MSTPNNRGAAIAGRLLGDLIQLGLMGWAITQTDGWLRGCLIGYVAFVILVHACVAAVAANKSPEPKPVVHKYDVTAETRAFFDAQGNLQRARKQAGR